MDANKPNAEYRVNIKYEKGKKVKAVCSLLVGGALLSATVLGSMFALSGCGKGETISKADSKGSISSIMDSVESVSDAKRLYDGVEMLASQYQAGEIEKSEVESTLATAMLLQSTIDANLDSVSEEDIGLIGDSWTEMNEIDTAKAKFSEAKGKSDYNTLYDTVKDICKKLGINVYEMELSKDSIAVKTGSTDKIEANVKGSSDGLTWTSSNEKIATVDADGNVKAVGEGSCIITCALTEDATVTKEVKVEVSAIKVSKIDASSISVKEGSKKELKASVNEDATNKGLAYKSSNEKIATVDSKGKVKGVKEGKCQITITSKDGACSVTVDVTVKDKYGVKDFDESKTMYSTGCNFRKGPGTDYDIIKYLDVNTKIKVTGEVDNWYEAEIDGKKGFVGKDVVQKSKVETQTNNNNGGGSTSTNNSGGSSNNNWTDNNNGGGSSNNGGGSTSNNGGGSTGGGSSNNGGGSSNNNGGGGFAPAPDDGNDGWGGSGYDPNNGFEF